MPRTAKPAAFVPRVEPLPPVKPKTRPLGEWEQRLEFVKQNQGQWVLIAECPSKAVCGVQARSLIKKYGNQFQFERREVEEKGKPVFKIFATLRQVGVNQPAAESPPSDGL